MKQRRSECSPDDDSDKLFVGTYLPWYPQDWQGSLRVREMSAAARGVYREMLDIQWVLGACPDNIARVGRLTGLWPEELEPVWDQVRELFTETPAGLVCEKLEKVRGYAASRSLNKLSPQGVREPVRRSSAPQAQAQAQAQAQTQPTTAARKRAGVGDRILEAYPEHAESVQRWLAHRREAKLRSWTEQTWRKNLDGVTAADFAARVEQSIRHGWQGLFEVSNGLAGPRPGKGDALDRALAEAGMAGKPMPRTIDHTPNAEGPR